MNNGKELWKTVNNILGRKGNLVPFSIEVEGSFLTKPEAIANYFNDYFINKTQILQRNMSKLNGKQSCRCIRESIMKEKNCQFINGHISEVEVEKLISSIQNERTFGTDNLDGKILKMAVKHITKPVSYIFNLSIEKGIYPALWKEAKVIPLPKDSKGSLDGPNSRPISLLPVLGKLLEKVITSRVQNYLFENNLLTNSQHAYRRGHSTGTALIQMNDDWLKELEERKLVGAVLLDLRAAFDVLNHKLLLEKLACYGMDSTVINWFKSYLSNRSQRVFYNGSFSENKDVNLGVPQGSCLGPLLFSVYINDLPLVLKNARLQMYADDTTLYASAATVNNLSKRLKKELMSVTKWIKDNQLILNIPKTKTIIIGCKSFGDPELKLEIDGEIIEQVKEVKLLGVIIDNRLSWGKHIENIVTKMGKILSVIRRCAQFLTQKTLKIVTQSLVLSNLDYCAVVWSNAAKKHLTKLQKIQNKAARMVLRCPYRTNINRMHNELKWLKVEDRWRANLVGLVKNTIDLKYPVGFYDQLQQITERETNITRYSTKNYFKQPRAKTNYMCKTVIYRAIKEWNCLPAPIPKTNSKTRFKKLINEHYLNYMEGN